MSVHDLNIFKKSNLISLFYFLSVVTTLISQLPQILETGLSAYFQLIWVLPLGLLIIFKTFRIDRVLLIALIILLLLTIILSMFHFFGIKPYLNSPHLINLYKSILILIISYNSAFHIDMEMFSVKLGLITLFCGLFLALGVYSFSFVSDFQIESREYAYSGKNSISQIILSCLILSTLLLVNYNDKIIISIRFFNVFFSIFVLLLLKSRASILGFLVVLVILFFQSTYKFLKWYILIGLFMVAILLANNDEFKNILIKSIFLAGRDGGDLNDASSGRFDFFIEFPHLFAQNILFGYGNLFSESFPLSVLLDYGLIWSLLVFFVVLIPVIYWKRFSCLPNVNLLFSFKLVIIIHYINALFEQQAPIGPGAKNFLLWSILGILLGLYRITIYKARID